eukprot:Rhum_TRINITY_DN21175_c0_g1::Rhum_TRINITY_DN21175_c0_g1_i1::g.173370::m.173370
MHGRSKSCAKRNTKTLREKSDTRSVGAGNAAAVAKLAAALVEGEHGDHVRVLRLTRVHALGREVRGEQQPAAAEDDVTRRGGDRGTPGNLRQHARLLVDGEDHQLVRGARGDNHEAAARRQRHLRRTPVVRPLPLRLVLQERHPLLHDLPARRVPHAEAVVQLVQAVQVTAVQEHAARSRALGESDGAEDLFALIVDHVHRVAAQVRHGDGGAAHRQHVVRVRGFLPVAEGLILRDAPLSRHVLHLVGQKHGRVACVTRDDGQASAVARRQHRVARHGEVARRCVHRSAAHLLQLCALVIEGRDACLRHGLAGAVKHRLRRVHGDPRGVLACGNLGNLLAGTRGLVEGKDVERLHLRFVVHVVAPAGHEHRRHRALWEGRVNEVQIL